MIRSKHGWQRRRGKAAGARRFRDLPGATWPGRACIASKHRAEPNCVTGAIWRLAAELWSGILWGRADGAVTTGTRKGSHPIATPLTPIPPNPQPAQAKTRTQIAFGAGIAALTVCSHHSGFPERSPRSRRHLRIGQRPDIERCSPRRLGEHQKQGRHSCGDGHGNQRPPVLRRQEHPGRLFSVRNRRRHGLERHGRAWFCHCRKCIASCAGSHHHAGSSWAPVKDPLGGGMGRQRV